MCVSVRVILKLQAHGQFTKASDFTTCLHNILLLWFVNFLVTLTVLGVHKLVTCPVTWLLPT